MYWTMDSSISSPAMRTDLEYTIPESEITATSVVPPPMSTIMFPPGSWMGSPAPMAAGHRLLDQVHLARARLHGGIAHGALLDLGDPRGNADHDAGPHQGLPPMHLADEVVQHLLRHVEVGDDAVLERADGGDIAWGPAEHGLGLVTHRQHRVIGVVDGDDRRLVHHDAFAANVHEGVRGAQIDGEIVREQPRKQAEQHRRSYPLCKGFVTVPLYSI
jgi:hypothetical protein